MVHQWRRTRVRGTQLSSGESAIPPCSLHRPVLSCGREPPARATGPGAVRRFGVRQRMASHPAHVLAAVLVALAALPAAAQTAIKFTLDGPVEGPEALLLLPRDKGYFKAEGRDVAIYEEVSAREPSKHVG